MKIYAKVLYQIKQAKIKREKIVKQIADIWYDENKI